MTVYTLSELFPLDDTEKQAVWKLGTGWAIFRISSTQNVQIDLLCTQRRNKSRLLGQYGAVAASPQTLDCEVWATCTCLKEHARL